VGKRQKGGVAAGGEGKGSHQAGASEKPGLPPIPIPAPMHRRLWSFGSTTEGYESETAAWAQGEAGSRAGSRNPSESGSVSTGEAEVRLGLLIEGDRGGRQEAELDPDSPGTEGSARVVPTFSASDAEGESGRMLRVSGRSASSTQQAMPRVED
jgi:hypothetical protein